MPKANEFEIKLIKTVEQYPCLYNFRLPEYSRREVVGAAWEKVAKEINATVQDCKDTWRTLRITYTRAIKLPPSGSGAKKLTQKTKEMIKEMDYIRSYVNVKRSQELPSNLPPLPSPESQDAMTQETTEEGVESVDNANDAEETVERPQLTSVVQPSVKKIKKTRHSNDDNADRIDTHVLQYIKSKQQREPENPKRLFLLSLLPDLEQMNDRQMRCFRTKVSALIDEILNGEHGPSPSRQSSLASWHTERSRSSTSTNLQEQTSEQQWFVNSPRDTNLQQFNVEENSNSYDQQLWLDRYRN